MSDTQWYIEREGVEYGPCTWDGLQALAQQGTLRPTDLVRRDGDTFFVPAHQARCDGPAHSAEEGRQVNPVAERRQISELAGPAATATAKAAVPDALERAVEEDVQLSMADANDSPLTAVATMPVEPVVEVIRTATAAAAIPAPTEAARAVAEPARAVSEPARAADVIAKPAAAKAAAAKTKVVKRKAALKTAVPAETIVELELDETLAPAAEPEEQTPANFTGPAVLALVCAVGGLFWFGLLLGFVSVVLAVRALRAMGRHGGLAPRGVAMAALMLGAADLIVLVTAIATHARLASVLWN